MSAPRGFPRSDTNTAPKITAAQASSVPRARTGAGENIDKVLDAAGVNNPAISANQPGSPSTGASAAGPLDEAADEANTPATTQGSLLGRFRTASGYVRVEEQLLDSYKNSVVRVTALDSTGNTLNEAMGVAVGMNESGILEGDTVYIAAPLSTVMGNDREWADRLQCTHHSGASYSAEIALIDQALDLVLLKPKNKPTAIRSLPESQERTQIGVITIQFNRDRRGEIVPVFHRGTLAALSQEEGTLAISGKEAIASSAGTAIISLTGHLVGMLQPNGGGVLMSAISKDIRRAKGRTPFPPRLVGVIMGKGVLVDPNLKDAYPTIPAALADIKAGNAPKPDPTRYFGGTSDVAKPIFNTAKNRPVLKIAAGTFTLAEPLEVPSDISISGMGPKETILLGASQDKPVLLFKGTKNASVANLRITPSSSQKDAEATVRIADSNNVQLVGNVIEGKGGKAAVYLLNANGVSIAGNAFPEGKNKALYCQNSSMTVEANSFLGKWPQAIAYGLGCSSLAEKNLFVENEISHAVSSSAKSVLIRHNTMLRDLVGVRIYGSIGQLAIEDNIFYSNRNSILSSPKILPSQVGRNTNYQSLAFEQDKPVQGLDFIKGKPEFRNLERYDLRLLPGSPGANSGMPGPSGNTTDVGAYQNENLLGEYTSQFVIALETALGEKNLAEAWGFKILRNPESSAAATSPLREPTGEKTEAKKVSDSFPLEDE